MVSNGDGSLALPEKVTTTGFWLMSNGNAACTDTEWIPVALSQFSIYLAKASEDCQVSKSVACRQKSVKGCK